jgi:hypothetical protein
VVRLKSTGTIIDSNKQETHILSARHKLNGIYAGGSLAVAAIIGALAGSWAVFATAAVILIGCSFAGGDIRPNKRRR